MNHKLEKIRHPVPERKVWQRYERERKADEKAIEQSSFSIHLHPSPFDRDLHIRMAALFYQIYAAGNIGETPLE